MYNETFKSIKDAIKHWYLLLILGITFILTGIWALITPETTYLSLALLFSVTFFITGILEIFSSISYRKQLDGWGWSLAAGMLDFLIGVILLLNPQISIISLPLFVGFVVLYRSAMDIAWSIELKRYKESNWGFLLLTGILGVVFSFILLLNPLFTGITVAVFTGIALIIIGIFHILFSIELKKLNKTVKKSN
ncbi:MAG TPA: DUF308 domain-containing protein [Ignavibacteriaceae bacterium]|nr:DUF308 domain-containing protein [Ignavibacteriaceae bacterium]